MLDRVVEQQRRPQQHARLPARHSEGLIMVPNQGASFRGQWGFYEFPGIFYLLF